MMMAVIPARLIQRVFACGTLLVGLGAAACGGGSSESECTDCAVEGDPAAFRLIDLDLRDPHTFVDILGCRDVTDQEIFNFSSNRALQESVELDDDGDGLLDLSLVLSFAPYAQQAASTPVTMMQADCTAPLDGTTCTASATVPPVASTVANEQTGQCLDALAGTTGSYDPAIAFPTGPCFTSEAVTLGISLLGTPVELTDVRVAAQYPKSGEANMAVGVMRGFLSEATADAANLPGDLPIIGGDPISSVLVGGTNNCAPGDDRDENGAAESGWYVYFNFVAAPIPVPN